MGDETLMKLRNIALWRILETYSVQENILYIYNLKINIFILQPVVVYYFSHLVWRQRKFSVEYKYYTYESFMSQF